MRKSKADGAFSANIIAGTHTVVFGFNMPQANCADLLGFAIHRTDHSEDEAYWLNGQKRFKFADGLYLSGREVSTRFHPIQSFLWQDFTAKPDHDYSYRFQALRGDPANPTLAETVEIRIQTEPRRGSVHSVIFNRGAVSSQKYAEEFNNQDPRTAGPAAFHWLSRGLMEGLVGFIGRANAPGLGLRAAMYEFEYPPVLEAFRKAAKDDNADVRIVYDGRENQKRKPRPGAPAGADPGYSPKDDNKEAIDRAGIADLCTPRTKSKSYIAHNKFIIFGTMAGSTFEPKAVWTGSTNITDSGIFGHLNVGHVVEDETVAKNYYAYWKQLEVDPTNATLGAWTSANPAANVVLAQGGIANLFSPRLSSEQPSSLSRYVELMDKAVKASFLTGAFGLPAPFVPVLEKPSTGVRYVLLDSYGKGKPEQVEARKAKVRQLRRNSANKIVVATLLVQNQFDKWLRERLNPISTNVRYLHTKFLLLDPLSDDPVVVTGSANFSDASTVRNDENMLLIRGDTHVADIYLSEFMRLYRHYAFREWVLTHHGEEDEISYLDETFTWPAPYFQPGGLKDHQRRYFAA